jgi:hypothetical protein
MRSVFEIEEFYHPEDGDDFYPAMWRAQQVLELPPDSIHPQGEIGWTILFGPRIYRFSRPIEIVRCMHLQGSGGSDVSGTRFQFFNDTPGIIIHLAGGGGLTVNLPDFLDETEWQPQESIPLRRIPPANDPEIPQGKGTIIERIYVEGSFKLSGIGEAYVNGGSFLSGQTSYALYFDKDTSRTTREERDNYGILLNPFETMTKPDHRCHGIVAYARFTLKNSVVKGFSGHGIYIYGNTNVSNADGWQIDTVTTQENGNNGLHLVGEDASPGIALSLDASGNRFWGVADLSRGQSVNQFISGQTAYNQYGGFLRPRGVRFTSDPDPDKAEAMFPLSGMSLLRGFYGEDNGGVIVLADNKRGPNYADKFLQLNRFIWAYNVLEHCALHNILRDVVDGVITPIETPATGIDTGYLDSACNTIDLSDESIPSFNTGIRLQDRLSLMAFGSIEQRVWIRAATTQQAKDAESGAEGTPVASQPLNGPEIVFFTDPVAGGYIGSVLCILRIDDGKPVWGHRKFGKIEQDVLLD